MTGVLWHPPAKLANRWVSQNPCHRTPLFYVCSSVSQQGLLADKKREGRCPGDYFFFTVYVRHFSGFIEALDSKGISCTLKKVLRHPQNVLTL